jgi:hypothetical protein
MIVGAVRQEEEHSWQDACEAWEAQDGEMKASVHQVRADGVEIGHGEDNTDEQSEAESEGLLVEGDEREYILELLMREVPLNVEAGVHPTRAELATLRGKRKRNLGKKLRKRLKMAKSAAIKEPKEEVGAPQTEPPHCSPYVASRPDQPTAAEEQRTRKTSKTTADQQWEEARRNARLRQIFSESPSSEDENEDEERHGRFAESGRWRPELYGPP